MVMMMMVKGWYGSGGDDVMCSRVGGVHLLRWWDAKIWQVNEWGWVGWKISTAKERCIPSTLCIMSNILSAKVWSKNHVLPSLSSSEKGTVCVEGKNSDKQKDFVEVWRGGKKRIKGDEVCNVCAYVLIFIYWYKSEINEWWMNKEREEKYDIEIECKRKCAAG